MNFHQLTRNEAANLLFSFKKTLRDREGLTPEMEQFYDSAVRILREKLQRIDESDGRAKSSSRYRFAEVRPSWHPESLAQLSRDLADDSRKAGEAE